MATKGGEERKGEAVPMPIVSAVALAILSSPRHFQGFVSAVVLAILLQVQEHHHICEAVACRSDIIVALMARTTLINVVDMMLMPALALLVSRSRWGSRVFAVLALLMVVLLVEQSVRIVYVALSGSCYYLGGDIVKAVVPVAVIVVGHFALSLWTAKVMVSYYRADGQEQWKKRG